MVVLGDTVNTSPRSDADAATGGREQEIPFQAGFSYSRKDWQKVSLDHLAVLVKVFTKTSPLHVPARPSNTSGGQHNLFTHFPTDPGCDTCKRTKITRDPGRRNPDRSYNVSGSKSSQRRERNAITPSTCDCSARFGSTTDTELLVQKKGQHQRR